MANHAGVQVCHGSRLLLYEGLHDPEGQRRSAGLLDGRRAKAVQVEVARVVHHQNEVRRGVQRVHRVHDARVPRQVPHDADLPVYGTKLAQALHRGLGQHLDGHAAVRGMLGPVDGAEGAGAQPIHKAVVPRADRALRPLLDRGVHAGYVLQGVAGEVPHKALGLQRALGLLLHNRHLPVHGGRGLAGQDQSAVHGLPDPVRAQALLAVEADDVVGPRLVEGPPHGLHLRGGASFALRLGHDQHYEDGRHAGDLVQGPAAVHRGLESPAHADDEHGLRAGRAVLGYVLGLHDLLGGPDGPEAEAPEVRAVKLLLGDDDHELVSHGLEAF
mmetsp:Transcript_69703/g.225391  ORF Transcript_69703/g.225391 Transcript_69703/m.225391 type:complete len:329 (-) Transcript_69703:252-1238(-)